MHDYTCQLIRRITLLYPVNKKAPSCWKRCFHMKPSYPIRMQKKKSSSASMCMCMQENHISSKNISCISFLELNFQHKRVVIEKYLKVIEWWGKGIQFHEFQAPLLCHLIIASSWYWIEQTKKNTIFACASLVALNLEGILLLIVKFRLKCIMRIMLTSCHAAGICNITGNNFFPVTEKQASFFILLLGNHCLAS